MHYSLFLFSCFVGFFFLVPTHISLYLSIVIFFLFLFFISGCECWSSMQRCPAVFACSFFRVKRLRAIENTRRLKCPSAFALHPCLTFLHYFLLTFNFIIVMEIMIVPFLIAFIIIARRVEQLHSSMLADKIKESDVQLSPSLLLVYCQRSACLV